MIVMTRQEALSAGLKRYFTGKTCPKGHLVEQRIYGGCVECARLGKLRWRKANPEKVRELKNANQKLHRDSANARNRKYREANLEKTRLATRTWAKANPANGAAKTTRYRARKLHATPAWADHALIAEYYETADGLRMLVGEHYHVDHIIPLQGKTVCGLHVHDNLQILTGQDNQSKSNIY